MKIFLAFFLFMSSSLALHAQDLGSVGVDTTKAVPEGLAVNAFAPLFSAPDTSGAPIDLRGTLLQSRVVLVFIRGAWSKSCRDFLSNLQDSLLHIENAPAQVIGVVAGGQEDLVRLHRKTGVRFSLVSDDAMQITKDYAGLYHMRKTHVRRSRIFSCSGLESQEDGTAPMPVTAVYIIEQSGKIRWRYFNYDHRERPSVASILEGLK